MRKQIGSAVAAALLAATPAAAQEDRKGFLPGEFTGSVAFTTDYVFRGISQTDNGPAVQGAIDWGYKLNGALGVYLGAFGTNVDFDEASGPGVDRASAELDFYGGFKGEVRGFSWQIGFIHYLYPKASPAEGAGYDFTELATKLGYDFGAAALVASLNYSGDYVAETGDGVYLAGDLTVPLPFLPFEIKALGHVGRQWIDDNARFGAPDYVDWLIGLTGTVEGFTLTLAYTDTDIRKSACFPGSGLTRTCEGRVLFTVAKTF